MAPQTRISIDWAPIRERLARQSAALEEVFAGRGRWAEALLDRRAEEMAAAVAGEAFRDAARGTVPVLVVRGTAGLYGLELDRVAQVVPLPRVARVPGAPPDLLGVIAVGGTVMRVFDLDRLCGAVGADDGAGNAVVLRSPGRRPAALRVAGVERVADVVRPDPNGAGNRSRAGELIAGLTAERIAVIDMNILLEAVTA